MNGQRHAGRIWGLAIAVAVGSFAGEFPAAQKASAQSERNGKAKAMEIEETVQRIRGKDWNLIEPPIRIPTNAAAAIAPLVTDPDQEIRELAVSAIDKTTGPEAKQALLKALGDRNEVVRGAAARFLHNHCAAGDSDLIVAHLRTNKDEYVREQLALLLGKLGRQTAVAPLQERFAAEEWPHAKQAISLALVRLGSQEHRRAYIGRLEQPEPKARVAALEDLTYLEDRTLATNVLRLLDDSRDGKNVGPSHGPYWIRVCDVAINMLDRLLGHPFPFEVRGNKRYSEQELEQARRLIH